MCVCVCVCDCVSLSLSLSRTREEEKLTTCMGRPLVHVKTFFFKKLVDSLLFPRSSRTNQLTHLSLLGHPGSYNSSKITQIMNRIKKERTGGRKCHAKTMMSGKACDAHHVPLRQRADAQWCIFWGGSHFCVFVCDCACVCVCLQGYVYTLV